MSSHSVHTARLTGWFYLAIAITGLLGFFFVRSALFVPGAPAETLERLVEREGLARLGIALELGIVASQALAALWFFRLFRSVDDFAAGAIFAFGLVNAIVLLVSSAMLATALQVALDPVGSSGDAQLMYLVSSHLWQSGNLFFGLWLMPMGWCVLRSRWMPAGLGRILIVGGVGYIAIPFTIQLVPGIGAMVELLALPATVGEFWMIGYLLTRGVNARGADEAAG